MGRLLVLFIALGGMASLVALAFVGGRSAPPSAQAIEARLLSPCCFGGTLDAHDSDIARELRAEIQSRGAAGEPAGAIEDDLVRRYGPQMRAMPNPGTWSATVTAVALVIVAAGFLMQRRASTWGRGAASANAAAVAPPDAYDSRLDAELEEMA
jgi:cytochrome c-type biogenesis protein CcmH